MDGSARGRFLTSVLHSDIEKIKLTMEAIDHEAFEMAVDTILKAKTDLCDRDHEAVRHLQAS